MSLGTDQGFPHVNGTPGGSGASAARLGIRRPTSRRSLLRIRFRAWSSAGDCCPAVGDGVSVTVALKRIHDAFVRRLQRSDPRAAQNGLRASRDCFNGGAEWWKSPCSDLRGLGRATARATRPVAEEVGGSEALALRLAPRVIMLATQQNRETLESALVDSCMSTRVNGPERSWRYHVRRT